MPLIKQLNDATLSENYNMLIVGESGSGKTTLASTAPGKKFFFQFDQGGLESVIGKSSQAHVEYATLYPQPHLKPVKTPAIATIQGGDPCSSWAQANKLLGQFTKECPYDVVVVDSLTSMALAAWTYVRARQGLEPGEIPKQAGAGTRELYQALGEQSLMFFYGVLALPCSKIFIAHETSEKDERTGAFKYKIAGEGRMFGDKLSDGKQFSQIFRTEALSLEDDTVKYQVVTRGSSGFPTKSRWANLNATEEPDIAAMLAKATSSATVAEPTKS